MNDFACKATQIQKLSAEIESNTIYIKRDDMIPYSFGGNKVRKALMYFQEIEKSDSSSIVTYGSVHSNHCRVVANMAAAGGYPCYIVCPSECDQGSSNQEIIKLLGGIIIRCALSEVNTEITNIMNSLAKNGDRPFFIPGGGHGIIGTKAYVEAFEEVLENSKENSISYDYIFLASGTGATQAGLICGKVKSNSNTQIVGISIARKNPYGRKVVLDSTNEYLNQTNFQPLSLEEINFVDTYILDGYGSYNENILETIRSILISDGIAMDATYTGKAYWGMKEYLKINNISSKNVLFLHTGGTPLFFDNLKVLINE